MLLSDLFATLSYGELSNLAIAGGGTGTITAEKQPQVIVAANKTLSRLSRDFPYKICYVKLLAQADTSRYNLDPVHAVSNTDVGNTAIRYLNDADFTFDGSLIKVREVTRLDRTDTTEIDETLITSLNKRSTDSGFGVRLNGTRALILEQPLDGDIYEVEYQARAATIASDVIDLTAEIDIPAALETALELGTAARVWGSMNNELAIAKTRELWARYGEEVATLEFEDMMGESENDGFDKLRDKGFV